MLEWSRYSENLMSNRFEDTALFDKQPPRRLKLSPSRLVRNIFRLALPAVAENLLLALMMLVDVIFVAHYAFSSGGKSLADTAISAVGTSSTLGFVLMVVFMPVSLATNALISRHIGARDMARARRTCAQSTKIVAIFGTLVSILLVLLVDQILVVMKLGFDDPKVLEYSKEYLMWIFPSFVFRLLLMNSGYAVKAAGNTHNPMIIAAFANILNIVLDYGLIFGKLGMPEMGIQGAGLATAIASLVGGGLMTALLFTRFSAIHIGWRHIKGWSWRVYRSLTRIALPGMIEQLGLQGAFVLYLRIVTDLGKESLAAFIITSRIEGFSMLPAYGFGIACATLVGQSLGAGKPRLARQSMFYCGFFGSVLMAAVGVALFVWRKDVSAIFYPSEEVLSLAAQCLVVAAISQIPIGFCMILMGGLRGAGDTISPMIVALIGVILIRLPLAYYFVIVLDKGLIYVWWASVIDWIVRAVIVVLIARFGRWHRIKV